MRSARHVFDQQQLSPPNFLESPEATAIPVAQASAPGTPRRRNAPLFAFQVEPLGAR